MRALRTLPIFIRKTVYFSNIRKYGKSYDGDGKTKVNILNLDAEQGLMINTYSQYGFRLNNGVVVIGPMVIFPRSVLSWNVRNYADINENSLSLFYTLEPKIDILLIGIGNSIDTREISKNTLKFSKNHKINVEILTTDKACATFNFLNAESRLVAAALIPPQHMVVNENDMLQTKLRTRELFESSD